MEFVWWATRSSSDRCLCFQQVVLIHEDTLTTRPKRVVYRFYEHILGLDTVKRIRSQDDVDTFRKDSSEIPHAIVNTSDI